LGIERIDLELGINDELRIDLEFGIDDRVEEFAVYEELGVDQE
jgi:hypothetical protein